MRFFTPLLLWLLALALFACADPTLREPQPQPIIPGDSAR
jgi:hypothetical protein